MKKGSRYIAYGPFLVTCLSYFVFFIFLSKFLSVYAQRPMDCLMKIVKSINTKTDWDRLPHVSEIEEAHFNKAQVRLLEMA